MLTWLPGAGQAVFCGGLTLAATPVLAQSNDHIFPAAAAAKPYIDFDNRGFLVKGKRTFIVSAGLEYARIPRALWEDRLLRLKRDGFNCVEVYTFWNAHEPREGVFDFSGDHDLNAFLQLVKELGLYAIVRVGPYYCAEWDNGGYPLWLRFKEGVRVRVPNEPFEKYVGLFFDHLFPIVAANQINHGGAVILVQLENEHPKGWGTSMPDAYFHFLQDKALALGLEVPYFFSGLHHGNDPAGDALSLDDANRPNPWFSTEFWSVWYDGYGSTEKEARIFERRTWNIIAHGGNGYNFYMAHGGSNFAYTNNNEDAASYDYGAAVGQGGDLRPIYYAFKRQALFARAFQDILENSVAGTDPSVRQSPAGSIHFIDSAFLPIVSHFTLEPGIVLERNTARILTILRRRHEATLVVYGNPGDRDTLLFAGKPALPFLIPDGKTPDEHRLVSGDYRIRVLVMSQALADRTWVVDSSLICGPRYVGEVTNNSITTESPLTEPDAWPIRIYTEGKVRVVNPATPSPPATPDVIHLTEWRHADGTPSADDRSWVFSEYPHQMGADGDLTADAWYRTTVRVDTPGVYTLRVQGSDRATAFADGVWAGPVSIKDGEIPFDLTKGPHVLSIFTAHDGRDKLVSYLGPIDSSDRKGLFGKAVLVKGGPSTRTLDGWRVQLAQSKDDLRNGPPTAGSWQPYKIGDDAFDKKVGFGWFQATLPDPAPGARQMEIHFASVDENATVFVNGHRMLHHDGWNAPFDVLINRVDTFSRPLVLTVFVENYSNEGGIDQPVRADALASPVAVKGWRMRGGPGEPKNWIDGPGDSTQGPLWSKTVFDIPTVPVGTVYRVIPRNLGHGSIWVNGHNLGRYPEKIPVNGLYIPECWLKPGENTLVIYDEDGKNARAVTVEKETTASRTTTVTSFYEYTNRTHRQHSPAAGAH